MSDWVFWAVLHDSGRITVAATYKSYCQIMYKANEILDGFVPEVVTKFIEQARSWVYGVLAAAIKDQAGARIRQPQIDGYDFANSIDPTHTMAAKDANDHPIATADMTMVIMQCPGRFKPRGRSGHSTMQP